MYALFKHNKQISKAHPHRLCVVVEAYERKLVMTKLGLLSDYVIREV